MRRDARVTIECLEWVKGNVTLSEIKNFYQGRWILRRLTVLMIVMMLPALSVERVSGQDLVVYPAKGQAQEQMQKDKYECYGWAKQQTGFDPMQSQPPA